MTKSKKDVSKKRVKVLLRNKSRLNPRSFLKRVKALWMFTQNDFGTPEDWARVMSPEAKTFLDKYRGSLTTIQNIEFNSGRITLDINGVYDMYIYGVCSKKAVVEEQYHLQKTAIYSWWGRIKYDAIVPATNWHRMSVGCVVRRTFVLPVSVLDTENVREMWRVRDISGIFTMLGRYLGTLYERIIGDEMMQRKPRKSKTTCMYVSMETFNKRFNAITAEWLDSEFMWRVFLGGIQ